ncbi:MAG: hypothetical protein JNM53_11175, partial [Gemmatimonadetes bacterium]|nr:hypothetical protein [Gemmatimonadota bacterium]
MKAPRWAAVLGPAVALFAIGGQWYTARSAETRIVDAAHLALARHAAAYVAVVTPGTAGAGYDAPRLLSGANALATASFWPGELQVAYGQTPLTPDLLRLAPLPDSSVALLEQGVEGMIATHAGVRAAVVPFLDRDQWTLRGWVAAWDAVPGPGPPAHPRRRTLGARRLVGGAGGVADRGGRVRGPR